MRRGRTAAFGLLVALALWGVAPVVVVVVRLIAYGDVPTGADGPLAGDQLQYLAWVRDAGAHVLASNLFELGPSAHVFAHPMFTLSGLLWWLGAPVAVAYLVWKPVAIGVVFAGTMALAQRLLPSDGWARVAATALALSSFSPIAAGVLSSHPLSQRAKHLAASSPSLSLAWAKAWAGAALVSLHRWAHGLQPSVHASETDSPA